MGAFPPHGPLAAPGHPRDEAGLLRQPQRQPRGHEALRAENAGLTPWCGPAALALATGLPYLGASDALRGTAPGWYPAEGPVVTAYWRDLLAALRALDVEYGLMDLPAQPGFTLLRMVRDGLAKGWYLVRVTDHFLLLECLGFGLARVHDNRHSAALLGARTHGRRKVTHAARLLGGVLVERPFGLPWSDTRVIG